MLIRKTQQPSTYPENQIHDSYSQSITDTYSCNYINEATKVRTLWTNNNPNSAFASQNITLSSSDYDYLECFYYNYCVSGYRQVQSVKVPKGYNFNLATTIFASDNVHYGSRPVTRNSDTSFTFGENKGVASWNPSSVLTDNTWAVPIKIVGYKPAK